MQSVFLAAIVAVASATSTLRPPVFSSTENCGFLPNRPAVFVQPPPRPEYLCDGVKCPTAPSECWWDSRCADGFCLPFVEKPFGSYCDDGDSTTFNDVCLGNGKCAGQQFTCPSDITRELTSRSDRVHVSWQAPVAKFGKVDFAINSNYNAGDAFFEGTTEVVYTAVGTDNSGGRVELTCNFYVRVMAACDEECCNSADGTFSTGVVARDHFAPRELDAFESVFAAPATFTCQGEKSVCSTTRKFLPPRLPMPPPIAPPVGELPEPTTTTRRTTTTTTTTTTTESRATTCDVVDVVFVLDTSGSVGQSNFNLAQQFVADAVSFLDVGSDQVRVAGVTFNFEATTEFDFDDHMTKAGVQNAVRNIAYPGGSLGTATGAALNFIRNDLLRTRNGWRGGETVVYFITDGASQETDSVVSSAATALLNSGVEVVAIGITDLVDVDQLETIGGSSDNVITVSDFDQLTSAVRDDLVGRVCPDVVLPTTSVQRITVTAGTPQCQGRLTNEETPAACRCEPQLDDCHTCGWAFGAPVTRSCSVCKNGKFLHNGQCVDACPARFTETGRGNFFRTCEEAVIETTTAPGVSEVCAGRTTSITSSSCLCNDDCHTCAWVAGAASTCSLCKNGAYLYSGECVESCPAGTTSTGRGNFGRRCLPTAVDVEDTCVGRSFNSSGASCNCGGNCHTCDFRNGAKVDASCSVCKNGLYLHNGVCVDTCPAGTVSKGTGNFFRTCEGATTGPSDVECRGRTTSDDNSACFCEPTLDNCHTCGWANGVAQASSCSVCKNGAFLLNGVCVASCPTGFTASGSGNFFRTCEPTTSFTADCEGRSVAQTGASCSCGGDCHTCEWDPTSSTSGTCSMCKNGAHLLDGECVESCPTGFAATGRGNFGRACVANRRRSLQGMEAAAADTAVVAEASSPVLIIGGVLVAFGVVVMAVVSGRKYISSHPKTILPTVEGNEVQPLAHVNSQ